MDNYTKYLNKIGEFGVVREVNHPIVVISGLPYTRPHEIVLFETGQWGEVYAIEKDVIEVLVFSKDPIKVGTQLTRTNNFLAIPIGPELLGKIVDPLGNPFSTDSIFKKPEDSREIITDVQGIGRRARIKESFNTGVTVVDVMIPLGKGQKELVIGDRKTGKTVFLLSMIKNQIGHGTIAVYAAIGKRMSDIKKLKEFFKKEGLDEHVIIVASSSQDSPSLINLTPYSAMTIAEYFRDQGQDSLVLFDDLSTHAKFYREIALISKRFPGRESYPGDIFYTHARLLERAGNFKHPTKGEVTITCFPVVEIVEGDLTGYIATNLMGMTDGHIFFDSNVYYKGRRPAINLSLSVTRVGRQTQSTLSREINRELTAFLGLYERMENFSHFGAELSEKIKVILRTGQKVYRLFNQNYNIVVPKEVQLIIFALIWAKVFDEVDDEILDDFQSKMLTAYAVEQNKVFFNELVAVDNLYKLLTNVTKKKEDIFKLCQLNIALNQT